MRFIFAMLATAVLMASPAMAAEESGFYVGAGFGSFGVDVDDLDFSSDDTSFKVLAGYNFMKYFGAELEYIDGGSAEETYNLGEGFKGKIAVDVTGFNAALTGRYPIADSFDVFDPEVVFPSIAERGCHEALCKVDEV